MRHAFLTFYRRNLQNEVKTAKFKVSTTTRARESEFLIINLTSKHTVIDSSPFFEENVDEMKLSQNISSEVLF